MDALFHLAFSLAGGYILVKGLRLNYGLVEITVLSLLSLVTDLDHFTEFLGIKGISTHTLLIVLVPLAVYLILLAAGSFPGKREYFLILAVLFFGHISVDMIEGMYGVPLFYPLSDRLYLIPERWEIYVNNDPTEPIVATQGIGVAAYFGVIALLIALRGPLLSSGGNGRRRSTRR